MPVVLFLKSGSWQYSLKAGKCSYRKALKAKEGSIEAGRPAGENQDSLKGPC